MFVRNFDPAFGGTVGDDAELLKLVRDLREQDAQIAAWVRATETEEEQQLFAMLDIWWELIVRIRELPAHTTAGCAAKASVLGLVIRETARSGNCSPGEERGLMLARDQLGVASASSAV